MAMVATSPFFAQGLGLPCKGLQALEWVLMRYKYRADNKDHGSLRNPQYRCEASLGRGCLMALQAVIKA